MAILKVYCTKDLYKIFRLPGLDITVITHLNVNEYN